MWQDTLRHREPHLDGMRGLRRVTLNNNPQIGDAGVVTLVEALNEDLWIKGTHRVSLHMHQLQNSLTAPGRLLMESCRHRGSVRPNNIGGV